MKSDIVITYIQGKYIGEIVSSSKYDPPNSIRMSTDIADFPFRVIMKKDIESINGEAVNWVEPKEEVRFVQGSGGVQYTIKTVGGTTTCTCPGFSFRHTCKHLKDSV